MGATQWSRLFCMGVFALVTCLALAGCTAAETGAPLPEGHVQCPAMMRKQAPETQCVAPDDAQRLGAACSAEGVCVVVGGAGSTADGVVDCPIVHAAPRSTDPTFIYTPPCVRKSLPGGAYELYDGNGILIGAGTP